MQHTVSTHLSSYIGPEPFFVWRVKQISVGPLKRIMLSLPVVLDGDQSCFIARTTDITYTKNLTEIYEFFAWRSIEGPILLKICTKLMRIGPPTNTMLPCLLACDCIDFPLVLQKTSEVWISRKTIWPSRVSLHRDSIMFRIYVEQTRKTLGTLIVRTTRHSST